jgi:DNA-binding transcriptional MerR regulator
MLSEWRKFKGWCVLEFFLSKPESKIHIKRLARELNISPQTSNRYLRLYEAEGLLRSETAGNVVQFYLDNEHPLLKDLKRLYFDMRMREGKSMKEALQSDFSVKKDDMEYVCEEE